jgi:hypothetical protein
MDEVILDCHLSDRRIYHPGEAEFLLSMKD